MPFFYLTGHFLRSITPECTHPGLGSFHFARRYFGNRFFFLFLRLLRCFSSPGSPCMPMYSACSDWSSSRRVSPFRHLRINGHLLLPAAFRSLSRLSSALSAKHPPCALISLTITLLHSVATVGRSELFSVCNLRYLCLLLNDFSFFLRIFRCASDVLKLACSFLYKHLFLDISVCSFQCTIFYYEVFRLRLETERFELLTPCLQGRCSPN